jgi:dTDP-4-dehydrorhamnose reductase
VQTIRLSNQEYRGITWVMEVVDQIEKIIELPGGIYNAGSTNSITTYETGRKVVEQLQKQGLPSAQIEMGDWQRNLAMDISKIEQFGVHFSDTTQRLIQWIQ